MMNNKEIYRKTVGFSVRRLLWDMLAFLILAALGGAGYAVSEKVSNKGLVGMGIGILVGIIAVAVFLRYVSFAVLDGKSAKFKKLHSELA